METKQKLPFMRWIALLLPLGLAPAALAAVEIDHEAIDKARSGKRIAVEANVTVEDGSESIREVRTYFRADNDGRWHYVPMQGERGDYRGLLPAPDVHTELVRYQMLAITASRQLAKSGIYNIEIVKDEEALARLNRQPPRDVKIDVSELQDARDIYEELDQSRRMSAADRQNIASESGEATPQSRVDVRSEYNPLADAVAGFDDYMNLTYTGAAEGYGVAAGIVSQAAAAATAPQVATVSKAAAGGGGSSTGWILGGIAVAAGGAAAASSGGGGGGGDNNSSPGVTNFEGRWTGPQTCAATGNAAFRWVVDLTQNDDQVDGIVAFHDCPGGGRATYNVTGTATAASSVSLDGTFAMGQGPLGGTAPANQTFTVSVSQPPDPNFAP